MDISFTIPEWLLGVLATIVAVPVLLMIWALIVFKRG